MRELFEEMNERNARMTHPSPLLVIDETLYSYHRHIGFKQYNPNKPAEYGLLYQSLCDSSIPYTYYSLSYTGKPERVEGPTTKYYSRNRIFREKNHHCRHQEARLKRHS